MAPPVPRRAAASAADAPPAWERRAAALLADDFAGATVEEPPPPAGPLRLVHPAATLPPAVLPAPPHLRVPIRHPTSRTGAGRLAVRGAARWRTHRRGGGWSARSPPCSTATPARRSAKPSPGASCLRAGRHQTPHPRTVHRRGSLGDAVRGVRLRLELVDAGSDPVTDEGAGAEPRVLVLEAGDFPALPAALEGGRQ